MIATGAVSTAYTLDYTMNSINRNNFSMNEIFVSEVAWLICKLLKSDRGR